MRRRGRRPIVAVIGVGERRFGRSIVPRRRRIGRRLRRGTLLSRRCRRLPGSKGWGRRRGLGRRCRRSGTRRRPERARFESWFRARFHARLARGIGFHLADGLFERQPLSGDVRLRKRRIGRTQLRDKRGTRPLVERAAGFAGALAKPLDGTSNERLIVGHGMSLLSARFIFIPVKFRRDFASKSCPRVQGWSTAARPNSRPVPRSCERI